MENDIENTRHHHTRAHPYKSPYKSSPNNNNSNSNSGGNPNNNSTTTAGLKITHNFFSFANNTTSLFPQQVQQQQHQISQQQQQGQRQPLKTLKTVSGNNARCISSSSSSLTSSSSTSSTLISEGSKRPPFQELNSNGTSFLKIPSSFKLTESSLTLLPQQETSSSSSCSTTTLQYENLHHDEAEEKISDVEMSIVISPEIIATTSSSSHHQEPEFLQLQKKKQPQKQYQASSLRRQQQIQERSQTPPHYPDYCVDILNNWNNSQYRSRSRKYMDKQKDISYRMRSILIDWLVEVALEFDTLQETLFLSTNIIDRFLSRMSVPKSKLQLIGTASFFIACKYEEVQPPGIKDFVYITDDTYTKEQIIRMEQIILQALDFDLMPPTSYTFTKAYTRLLQLTPQETSFAFYLTELSMIDGERYTTILPSLIATGAVALARYTYSDIFWDNDLCTLTPHVRTETQRCAQYLYNTFHEASTWSQSAVFEKYKTAKYCSVSTCLPKLPWP